MYRGGGDGWNTFWEPLSRHWERLRSSDGTPHMDVDLLDHVSFWNCPLTAISDYRVPSCMCKHLSLKNPEVQFKTKRESNECLSFWKNKLLNLRIWIRARLFWKKMPSSISGTPLNAQERSWPSFAAVSMMPHLLAGSKLCSITKTLGCYRRARC